jgi:hypothetical protein
MKIYSLLGFSIFEFVVYTALFSFITFLGTILISRSYMTLNAHEGQIQEIMDTSIVYDLFARDIYQAPIDKKLWHYNTHQIIWHIVRNNNDIGWCYEHACLYRIEGNYDYQKSQWRSTHKNLVAQHIKKLQFFLHATTDSIQAVSLVLSCEHMQEQEFYAGIRKKRG